MKKAILFLAGLILLSIITNACANENHVVSSNSDLVSVPGENQLSGNQGRLFANSFRRNSLFPYSGTMLPAPGLRYGPYAGSGIKTVSGVHGSRSILVSVR